MEYCQIISNAQTAWPRQTYIAANEQNDYQFSCNSEEELTVMLGRDNYSYAGLTAAVMFH